jgi:hypothetical protein
VARRKFISLGLAAYRLLIWLNGAPQSWHTFNKRGGQMPSLVTPQHPIIARMLSMYPEMSFDQGRLGYVRDGRFRSIELKQGELEAYDLFDRARSKSFDDATRVLTMNCTVEFPLIQLDSEYFREREFIFTDTAGNKVRVGSASLPYRIAGFFSANYERFASRRRASWPPYALSIERLLPKIMTATYIAKSRKAPSNLQDIALKRVRACLLKLSVERNATYQVYRPSQRALLRIEEESSEDWSIPNCEYDENVVGYYKVAKTSPFSGQSFLAYYNVLEYFFSRVAEDRLHKLLAAEINRPSFKASADGLDRIISIVRGQDAQRQEKELLVGVMQFYVTPADAAGFIKDFEDRYGKGFYTKEKKIFGKSLRVDPSLDSVIATIANLLKHVRNAIVHSTDVYDRTERHLPFSESDYVIYDYVPLVRFFAERVLFGTAGPG